MQLALCPTWLHCPAPRQARLCYWPFNRSWRLWSWRVGASLLYGPGGRLRGRKSEGEVFPSAMECKGDDFGPKGRGQCSQPSTERNTMNATTIQDGTVTLTRISKA